MIARQEGVNFDCAQDGSFEPLQCQPEGEDLRCVCVQPKDGTPIGGTQVIVDDVEDAPNNCAKLGE